MNEEQAWKVWTDGLTKLLNILLFLSLQIPQNIEAAPKSQRTRLLLVKASNLQVDQRYSQTSQL